MKRDMDLIREILLYIEANYKPGMGSMHIELEGFSSSLILEHCKLAFDSGLLQSFEDTSIGYGDDCLVGNLSSEGYDYLEKIRDNSIWHKVKQTVKEKGLPMVVETLKTVASAFITAAAEGVANSILKKS